jgi:hypothetical protein
LILHFCVISSSKQTKMAVDEKPTDTGAIETPAPDTGAASSQQTAGATELESSNVPAAILEGEVLVAEVSLRESGSTHCKADIYEGG